MASYVAPEIHARVVRVLVESLAVEEESVTPLATLHGDLGAESIDFLDIVFRLEREFDVHIPRDELFPESIFQGAPEFVRDGTLTDNGMNELRSRMPYADLRALEPDRRASAVPDLFTVELIARYITWKLRHEPATAENCEPGATLLAAPVGKG